MKRPATWLSLVFLGLGALAVVGPIAAWHPLPVRPETMPDRFTRVTTVLHVHTLLSDGGGSVEDVQRAAAQAGATVLILTDHNTFAGKPAEGYSRDGVLTIVGIEISNRQGHLLGLGIERPAFRFSGDAADALQDLNDLGGLSVVAHPENRRQDLRWTGWDLRGQWGLEVFNGDSLWREASWTQLIGSTLLYPVNPTYALLRLVRRPAAALTSWDRLLDQRRATAVAGNDAHGVIRPGWLPAVAVPGYEPVFRIMQNVVLLDHPLSGHGEQDVETVVDALRRGRVYLGIDALAPIDRFYFFAEREGGLRTMGEHITPGPGRLRAGGAFPAGAVTTLRRDGTVIAHRTGPLEYPLTTPGSYRVEVHVPGWDFPWIVSNAIDVRPAAEQQERNRGAMAPPETGATRVSILDRFGPDTTFRATTDATSHLWAHPRDLDGGPDSSSAGRIAFELGSPDDDHRSPFIALGSYEPRNLSGRRGLLLSTRSDRPRRYWVQIRDSNPDAPEGTETWFVSVKSDQTWRTLAIPFDRFDSVEPVSDHRLDLNAVEAIVLLVDTGAADPGTRGVIWVDDLGLF
ncbi:MAG: CehA/McbA family metallohydrolase [Acidobacteriota bacterium]|nr:CehA/McbA family metallohydrolase [Acidobacteriota bacterium]